MFGLRTAEKTRLGTRVVSSVAGESAKALIPLFAIAAAVLGETQISNAQSSYSYAWCAILPGAGSGSGGAMSCYYTSWEQCRTTMSGIGGLCVASPYYRQ